MRKRTSAFTIGFLVLLALALVPIEGEAYEPGRTDVSFTDSARGNRNVAATLYYPADTPGVDVPVASGTDRFPVIAFGHGYLTATGGYDWIGDSLAAYGFLVAFPSTEGDLFPDHEAFGLDLAFLAAELALLDTDSSFAFFGRVEDRTAVAGHSMGGGASYLAAASSGGAIDAIWNLAAAETSPSAIDAASGLTIPALLFAGGNDCVTPPSQHQIPLYEALLSTCKTLVTIAGASHCQFASSSFPCTFGEGGCPPSISESAQEAHVLALAVPWLRDVLRDEPGARADFELALADSAGFSVVRACPLVTSVAGHADDAVPALPHVLRVAPNPFNPSTTITLPALSTAGVLRVFDVRGRALRAWNIEGNRGQAGGGPGRSSLAWDGTDGAGRALPSGTYFLVLQGDGATRTARTVILR
ncbi:MAG: hypothetical protein HKN20_10705 [Gemmatimonadetes bacterium]|nr:hypothetical protein [Gemmatimonadota bacterium]